MPLEEIKYDNVAEFLTYGFWYKTREQMETDKGNQDNQLVSVFEQAWNITFEKGYNPKIKFMAHIWEEIRCYYRPLIFYIFIEYIYLAKHLILISIGFKFHRHENYTYYVYNHCLNGKNGKNGNNSNKVPILFWHGTGIGLFYYKEFLTRLILTGQPVIAFESPFLGMRWVSHIPEPDEVVDGVQAILTKHGIKRVCIGAHSYGTLHVSRYLQRYPEAVQSVYFIDPVIFFMFTGKTVQNFYYYPETKTDPITTFVARDIHHAAALARRFYWSVLNIWSNHLPSNTLVVLSGKDKVVSVAETLNMLKQEAPYVKTIFCPNHDHADFIKDPELQKQIVHEIINMIPNI